jgi:ammonia channel protein AmtB
VADTFIQVFASHAVGGVVGNILTGIFAEKGIAAMDSRTIIAGGWMDHHWIQIGYQLANSIAGMTYSFVVTVRNLLMPLPSYSQFMNSARIESHYAGHESNSRPQFPL